MEIAQTSGAEQSSAPFLSTCVFINRVHLKKKNTLIENTYFWGIKPSDLSFIIYCSANEISFSRKNE